MTMKLFLAPPEITGDASELPFPEKSRYRAAARLARRLFPGPIGELAHRELTAYADFGYRFSTDGLIPRLAAVVLHDSSRPGNNAGHGTSTSS
ncbi:hypothetical protein GCM10023215_47160 [Pseudonocardia yuanmonensis]|uniref:Uncharacterized protein n=1 Tax=Pseudonocardia yuanmonensis TaxID=1095914 RepID=A0ABP8X9G3_9PSEU